MKISVTLELEERDVREFAQSAGPNIPGAATDFVKWLIEQGAKK